MAFVIGSWKIRQGGETAIWALLKRISGSEWFCLGGKVFCVEDSFSIDGSSVGVATLCAGCRTGVQGQGDENIETADNFCVSRNRSQKPRNPASTPCTCKDEPGKPAAAKDVL